MANIILNNKRSMEMKQNAKQMLQPLDKNGFSSKEFNQVYGADKNPYTGTVRDSNLRGKNDKHKQQCFQKNYQDNSLMN